jgi:hypothetical protein
MSSDWHIASIPDTFVEVAKSFFKTPIIYRRCPKVLPVCDECGLLSLTVVEYTVRLIDMSHEHVVGQEFRMNEGWYSLPRKFLIWT